MKTILISILLVIPIIACAQRRTTPYPATTDSTSVAILQQERCISKYGYNHVVSPTIPPDTADAVRLQKKHFWRAAAETAGFNIGLWAFDRYVLDGHFAYISWNSIKENFKHGFEWDDDHLHTNMFDHPYNGSIFFNAGRSNGFNFWQSELFAIGGSAMWEMFMECEYPSTNDIIATPIGGAAIGEVLYRTSDLILDDRSSGVERFGREAAAFVVNPMRGLTRIISGDAWKRRSTSGRRFGIPPISIELSIGGRMLTLWDYDEGTRAGVAAEINIEYGDKFAEKTKAPYDYFSFLMEIQGMKTQPLLSRVEIVGRLLSREIINKKKIKASVGMYQHFDFFDSDTIKRREPNRDLLFPCVVPYKLGAPASVGAGVMVKYVPSNDFVFDGYAHANGLILAGILTDFYRDYHRNYNWGSGYSIKAGINASLFKNRLIVSLANQYYKVYTWKGYDQKFDWSTTPEGKSVNIQGDKSNSTFNHLEASLKYRLWERLFISAGADFYWRTTSYEDLEIRAWGGWTVYPILHSKQIGAHVMLTYVL
ncbi:MAG: DUF3943 domain-containing protein [Bacteroidales bacterium]|nr:DUF3943 domain-containing protein [Bacteroidales bacterium]